jgi:hypothetical protein
MEDRAPISCSAQLSIADSMRFDQHEAAGVTRGEGRARPDCIHAALQPMPLETVGLGLGIYQDGRGSMKNIGGNCRRT